MWRTDKINVACLLQITLGSTDVFMPKLRGLDQTGNGLDQNGNGSSSNGTGHHQAVFEVCLCPNGAFFAANIEKGCVDSARAFGSCNFTWNCCGIRSTLQSRRKQGVKKGGGRFSFLPPAQCYQMELRWRFRGATANLSQTRPIVLWWA